MNIPGAIDAELKAAREEGRLAGLRQASWAVGAALEEHQDDLDTCAVLEQILDALEAE